MLIPFDTYYKLRLIFIVHHRPIQYYISSQDIIYYLCQNSERLAFNYPHGKDCAESPKKRNAYDAMVEISNV